MQHPHPLPANMITLCQQGGPINVPRDVVKIALLLPTSTIPALYASCKSAFACTTNSRTASARLLIQSEMSIDDVLQCWSLIMAKGSLGSCLHKRSPTLAGSHLESMALACLQGGQVMARASKACPISAHSSCTSGTSPASACNLSVVCRKIVHCDVIGK